MRSRWGDEWDEELQRDTKIKVGFVFNYMQIAKLCKRFEEETREWDDKYPKNELMKMWGSIMCIMMVLCSVTYSILIMATGLFFFFYGHNLFQIYGVWKRFDYSKGTYWGMTLLTLAAELALSFVVKGFIFGG